ncbi:MAG: hypothetical protein OIF35_07005 [Cellvibrionaceae bacterium]|nr:hypothetical protein [Cellvibrionaceae bacterium]MCV6627866.1 hypothetical protein [Cellvibrionaceae bacterium]
MASTTILFLALGCAVCAFAVLFYVNKQEQEKSAFEQKSRFLCNRAQGLENQLAELENLIQIPNLYAILGQELIRRYEYLNDFDPSISSTKLNIQRAQANLLRYQQGQWLAEINRIGSNSNAIRRSERLLEAMRELLQRLVEQHQQYQQDLPKLVMELEYTELSVAVVSEIAQGHQLNNQGDFVQANGHYFQAQKLLSQSNIKHPYRAALATEVGEILSRKRLSISPELMPETQFNPSAKVPAAEASTQEQSL